MYQLVDTVVDVMGNVYPEIKEAPDLVKRVIRTEEETYAQTLGVGLQRLESLLAKTEGGVLSGEDVFVLCSTYGLPYDDIVEVAAERGVHVDAAGYQQHLARHREESRKGAKGTRIRARFPRTRRTTGRSRTGFHTFLCRGGRPDW
jgi:alanyl-tRNA synthetase